MKTKQASKQLRKLLLINGLKDTDYTLGKTGVKPPKASLCELIYWDMYAYEAHVYHTEFKDGSRTFRCVIFSMFYGGLAAVSPKKFSFEYEFEGFKVVKEFSKLLLWALEQASYENEKGATNAESIQP